MTERRRTVPVICDECGADLTAITERLDDDRRRERLECEACGYVALDVIMRRELVTARVTPVTGPRDCRVERIGYIWGPA